MYRLEIRYWHSKPNDLDWSGDEILEFACKKDYKKKLKRIMARIDDAGYNAMILNNVCGYSDTKVLFIDKGRFRQC